jgi:hypothetical protein
VAIDKLIDINGFMFFVADTIQPFIDGTTWAMGHCQTHGTAPSAASATVDTIIRRRGTSGAAPGCSMGDILWNVLSAFTTQCNS